MQSYCASQEANLIMKSSFLVAYSVTLGPVKLYGLI